MSAFTNSQYPRPCYANNHAWYGAVIDLYHRTGPGQKTYLGRFNTQEQAQDAYAKFLATGERPPKRKYTCKQVERAAYICTRKVKSGIRYDVKGKSNGTDMHIGTGATQQEAEAIRERFLSTGETISRIYSPRGTRAPRKHKPRKRAQVYKPKKGAKKPRGPRIKADDVRIEPGRNLRDNEFDTLKAHRPELVGGDPRARRPNESIGDWYRRLEVMKGYRAA